MFLPDKTIIFSGLISNSMQNPLRHLNPLAPSIYVLPNKSDRMILLIVELTLSRVCTFRNSTSNSCKSLFKDLETTFRSHFNNEAQRSKMRFNTFLHCYYCVLLFRLYLSLINTSLLS